MLNKRGKSEHPCFVPDFRENAFRFSLLNVMWAVCLIYGFYKVEVCFLYMYIVVSYYHKWIIVSNFSCIYWSYKFYSIYCGILGWFADIEPSYYPWDQFYLNIVWMILWIYFWVQLTDILLKTSASMFIRNTGLYFLCVCVCAWCLVWGSWCCPSRMILKAFLPLGLRETGINFSLSVLLTSPVKFSVLNFCWHEVFFCNSI